MKLLFFDLETTGTNPGRNGIHQISGQVVIDGIVKESFDFHVKPNPKAAIEDEALAVAGVTREQIAKYPAMGTVYRQFVAMLGKYVDKYNSKDKFFLVGYNNAAFDNQFLRGFFLQNNDKFFGSWFWANSMDVMVLATVYLANKRTDKIIESKMGFAQSIKNPYMDKLETCLDAYCGNQVIECDTNIKACLKVFEKNINEIDFEITG